MNPRTFMILFLLAAIAAHIGCIIFGRDWYLFFGAGEQMALWADQGNPMHIYVTSFVILALSGMAIYNFAASAEELKLPLQKLGPFAIFMLFLLRAIAGFIFAAMPEYSQIPENSQTFWVISSVICLIVAYFQFEVWRSARAKS